MYLVNSSIATTANFFLIGKTVCNSFKHMESKIHAVVDYVSYQTCMQSSYTEAKRRKVKITLVQRYAEIKAKKKHTRRVEILNV